MSLSQTFKNLRRTREIIHVVVKYGFEDIIANSTLRKYVPESKRLSWLRKGKPFYQYSRWERIRMACEELGPTFVKLAQIMSTRPDMLPDPLIKELEKLQDKVEPFSFKEVEQIIKEETGNEIIHLFDDFQSIPLASASIGQVHTATLKTGEKVVVKVQRPDIKEVIETDLSILKEGVRRSERYLKKQGILNAPDVVKAFERSILKELDYGNEGRNIERFRNIYKNYNKFYIPKAYRKISTSKILVIEYVSGCKIDNEEQIRKWGFSPKKTAELGMEIYLTQIFEYGIFHADPHPGNVLVRNDGTICLLDFGMTGQLMQKDKYSFAGIFISMANRDPKSMAMNLRRLAISHEINDMRSLQYELNDLIEDYVSLDVDESSIADFNTSLQKVMFNYEIAVPGSIFLIFRAFAILEGIGKKIHPHFNTYDFIRPYGAKILKEQYSPQNLFSELTFRGQQLSGFLNSFPGEIRDIMTKIRKGKFHIEVEHQGYGYLLKKMDSVTNRLVLSLLICATILGSSLLVLGKFPEQFVNSYGIPYISVAGYSFAGFLFLILIYSIFRRRVYK